MKNTDPLGLVTLSGGPEVDIGLWGPLGVPLGGGYTVSYEVVVAFSIKEAPFFTVGHALDIGLQGGFGWGIGSVGLSGAVTTASDAEELIGPHQYGYGVASPVADLEIIHGTGGEYIGIEGEVGPGAEIHVHKVWNQAVAHQCTKKKGKANWVWPWDSSASWSPSDTLELWIGY